ncbi:hypothetical protein CONCODRAFT_87503 [Conidiobolus coronatus NRRL 28638]|uniref:Uncharacterized protein n=1 Tax=Conidiobolus coronatus (strain ATCC 28846 / CBS 209.66 / NRRL 28638) TaxID=796925 RepID=A0A137NUD1_CONC2|nr:hypothetical protein CONCODRAFT_87503 [Conidiobolus coronatus NRRL 28638]|eukprot:KXN66328.1 hypothetical protein CONCODRAFT_87503 [Conidiobolus coronatus NRRL 28638]
MSTLSLTSNLLRNQLRFASVKNVRYLSVSRTCQNIERPHTNSNDSGKNHSPISNAPNWNHENATDSEQSVKADYEPNQGYDKFKDQTQNYLNNKYPKKQHNNRK